ncbi:diacylglycerol/lipid kinase family protein [Flavobacterium granuli]|uniref:Diacylglycerol kinase family enzyme n=1 Tax=Flavobacterium granuli TaxID=280093 RepID=A0A1M5N4H5_9FLAO|nr:diacylglycerol kinase family protein [Flavobacterium granuli]PRZ25185.1 diacylglycerol kinase family enzyme [Flavobacterium granuli]SHG84355.1 Diacylglycerol kinase family enzyme [Flavobacterium granuli]
MKNNVLMIVNPVSGGLDKSEYIKETALFAAGENLNFVLYETSGQDDISKVRGLYERFTPKRIIIAGGDGTLKMVVDAIENQDVILGILPAGSSNGLAVELNLVKTLEENLKIAFGNNFAEIDSIVINGQKSLHLSDLGLNAELIKNYEKSAMRGKWGYALQAFNTLIDAEKMFSVTITANNQVVECEARMIVIANAQKYGTGVVINPVGVMNDGKFELIILKNLDLKLFGKIITGNMPVNPQDVEIISTDKATIKTNVAVSFQIDGEYCGAVTKLDIFISSHKLKIAIP